MFHRVQMAAMTNSRVNPVKRKIISTAFRIADLGIPSAIGLIKQYNLARVSTLRPRPRDFS